MTPVDASPARSPPAPVSVSSAQGAGYTPGCEVNHRRNHPVNVHGCGIGWYARERCGLVDELGLDAYNRPTVYTTVAAPSHDRNLRALSKTISSSLLFGHVRAAGPGASVHQYNCHPFFMGRYMFMHNGDITDFSKVRRGLQQELRDDLFDHMSGTTDSELLFLLILNRLPDCHTQQDPATLQQAVLDAFCAVIKANRGKANSLNIAFTDGETTIATRYRNSDLEEPPSLYYHVGPMPGEKAWDLNNADLGSFDAMESDPNVHDHSGAARTREDTHNAQYSRYGSGSRHRDNSRGEKFVATQALLVSSEPLTGGKGLDRWELLPSNSMIVAAPTRPTVGRCTRAALVAKLKEISAGGGEEAQPLGEQRARAGDRGEVHSQPVPRRARGRVPGGGAGGHAAADGGGVFAARKKRAGGVSSRLERRLRFRLLRRGVSAEQRVLARPLDGRCVPEQLGERSVQRAQAERGRVAYGTGFAKRCFEKSRNKRRARLGAFRDARRVGAARRRTRRVASRGGRARRVHRDRDARVRDADARWTLDFASWW